MLAQLSQLVQQFGQSAVVENAAVPNEQNEAVLQTTSSSIVESLKNIANGGNASDLAELLSGQATGSSTHPVMQQVMQQVTGNLSAQFNMDNTTASNIASGMIPGVLEQIFSKAKDPNDSSISVTDILGSLTGGNGGNGLSEALSKYGSQFGLDQDGDGSVGLSDLTATVSKKGGIAGLLGKLFGK